MRDTNNYKLGIRETLIEQGFVPGTREYHNAYFREYRRLFKERVAEIEKKYSKSEKGRERAKLAKRRLRARKKTDVST